MWSVHHVIPAAPSSSHFPPAPVWVLHGVTSLLPSFCTDLGVCRVLPLTYSFSAVAVVQVFSPLLNYVTPEALPLLLMGSALASGGSTLEPAATGPVGLGGSFCQLLRSHLCTTPCYQSLATQTRCTCGVLQITNTEVS